MTDAATIHARRWWTLGVLCLSLLIIFVGNTTLNVVTLVDESNQVVATFRREDSRWKWLQEKMP